MVGSLNFNVIVTNGDEIGDCLAVQDLFGLEEGADLPLLVILWVELLKLGSSAYDSNIILDFLVDTGQKASRAHLYPTFCGISNNESHFRC